MGPRAEVRCADSNLPPRGRVLRIDDVAWKPPGLRREVSRCRVANRSRGPPRSCDLMCMY